MKSMDSKLQRRASVTLQKVPAVFRPFAVTLACSFILSVTLLGLMYFSLWINVGAGGVFLIAPVFFIGQYLIIPVISACSVTNEELKKNSFTHLLFMTLVSFLANFITMFIVGLNTVANGLNWGFVFYSAQYFLPAALVFFVVCTFRWRKVHTTKPE